MGVATWFFLPRELSHLCDVHNHICSIKSCHRTGHRSVPGTKWQTPNNIYQSTQRCALICNITRWLSHPVSCQNSTKWPGCLLVKGMKNRKEKKNPYPQEPSCISLSSRYSCNLSHSYLILQEFPARLMCYWFQVSCYWNGGGMGGEGELDYREWEQEIETREEGGGENGVQWLTHGLLSEALFHLYSTCYLSNNPSNKKHNKDNMKGSRKCFIIFFCLLKVRALMQFMKVSLALRLSVLCLSLVVFFYFIFYTSYRK